MRRHATAPIDCPRWCTEPHDPREDTNHYGETEHSAALVHDVGGAFVGLHRLDRRHLAGQPHVLVDPGDSLAYLTPDEAERLALAMLAAARLARPCC